MTNRGLIASGAAVTAFALLFLNPAIEIPGLALLHSSSLLAINAASSIDWAIMFVMVFVVVFLTGTVMLSKGFLEPSSGHLLRVRQSSLAESIESHSTNTQVEPASQ